MRRLYFLIPNIDSAKQIVDELLLARVPERHLHIVAKDGTSLSQEHLPEATLLEKSDVVPALERGIVVGGLTGLVLAAAALMFPPAGLQISGGAVLAIALVGAVFGAWVSAMIGVSVHNSRLTQYEAAIEAGGLLLMIDVPKRQVEEISELVKSHHPEAEAEGTEPTVPAFP